MSGATGSFGPSGSMSTAAPSASMAPSGTHSAGTGYVSSMTPSHAVSAFTVGDSVAPSGSRVYSVEGSAASKKGSEASIKSTTSTVYMAEPITDKNTLALVS